MLKIRDLFTKSIDRPINGVIKADQRDAESIWQELDEYVVTKQLTEYFRKFFDAYLAAADNPKDPVLAARMGVWVSGFFGSGKSHFIKILSYLLENLEAHDPQSGINRHAAQFFDERKIKDPMLLADIRRATKGSADVILFNIDAKADSKSERDVILQVFLRVPACSITSRTSALTLLGKFAKPVNRGRAASDSSPGVDIRLKVNAPTAMTLSVARLRRLSAS